MKTFNEMFGSSPQMKKLKAVEAAMKHQLGNVTHRSSMDGDRSLTFIIGRFNDPKQLKRYRPEVQRMAQNAMRAGMGTVNAGLEDDGTSITVKFEAK